MKNIQQQILPMDSYLNRCVVHRSLSLFGLFDEPITWQPQYVCRFTRQLKYVAACGTERVILFSVQLFIRWTSATAQPPFQWEYFNSQSSLICSVQWCCQPTSFVIFFIALILQPQIIKVRPKWPMHLKVLFHALFQTWFSYLDEVF